MDTTVTRHGVAARISEARELLAKLHDAERDRPPLTTATAFEMTLRGLFYVQAYAALEFCLTSLTQQFLQHVTGLSVQHRHLAQPLNAIALDPQLTSLAAAGRNSKWSGRRELFTRLMSNDAVACNDGVFGTFLQNVWPNTIKEVFACFGIDAPPTRQMNQLGYLEELVDKRNAVAHGRSTSSDAGRGKTLADLEHLLTTTSDVCTYLISTMESHARAFGFVQEFARATYTGSPA